MRPTELYTQILGIEYPWRVTAVDLDRDEGELYVFVELDEGVELACPTCGRSAGRYDHCSQRPKTEPPQRPETEPPGSYVIVGE